jgi:hypothetical protein
VVQNRAQWRLFVLAVFSLRVLLPEIHLVAGFEVFTAVKIELVVFWVLEPCGAVVGY